MKKDHLCVFIFGFCTVFFIDCQKTRKQQAAIFQNVNDGTTAAVFILAL